MAARGSCQRRPSWAAPPLPPPECPLLWLQAPGLQRWIPALLQGHRGRARSQRGSSRSRHPHGTHRRRRPGQVMVTWQHQLPHRCQQRSLQSHPSPSHATVAGSCGPRRLSSSSSHRLGWHRIAMGARSGPGSTQSQALGLAAGQRPRRAVAAGTRAGCQTGPPTPRCPCQRQGTVRTTTRGLGGVALAVGSLAGAPRRSSSSANPGSRTSTIMDWMWTGTLVG